jgi:hypothetical protein
MLGTLAGNSLAIGWDSMFVGALYRYGIDAQRMWYQMFENQQRRA